MLLVTGITGHSGKHFLNELIKENYSGKIRCIIRQGNNIDVFNNIKLDIEVFICDLSDKNKIDEAMVGVDTVLHIASIFYSVNIVESAIKNNVRRIILVHTTGIYSKYKMASVEYNNIESILNDMLNEHNAQCIYLRPTMIYGHIGDRNMIVFIKLVDKLRVFPIIDAGENLIQPVNGRDLGKAYYRLLVQTDIKSGDYILSGEKPISMICLFKLIGKILGKKTLFINCPLWLGELMAKILFGITLGRCDYIEKVKRMSKSENRSFSHEKAYSDFNYSPMPLEEGLKLEINEYINQKHSI